MQSHFLTKNEQKCLYIRTFWPRVTAASRLRADFPEEEIPRGRGGGGEGEEEKEKEKEALKKQNFHTGVRNNV